MSELFTMLKESFRKPVNIILSLIGLFDTYFNISFEANPFPINNIYKGIFYLFYRLTLLNISALSLGEHWLPNLQQKHFLVC